MTSGTCYSSTHEKTRRPGEHRGQVKQELIQGQRSAGTPGTVHFMFYYFTMRHVSLL